MNPLRLLFANPTVCAPRSGGTPARVIALPGGHFLNRDDKLLVATIVSALHTAGPGIIG